MKKRLLFSVKYALFCAFVMFLMVTVFAKHYRFDTAFFAPLIAAFLSPLSIGFWMYPKHIKRFRHVKTGLLALVFTLLLTALGFWLHRISLPDAVLWVSAIKALADAWLTLFSGILILVPAYVLLVYLAEEKKTEHEEIEN